MDTEYKNEDRRRYYGLRIGDIVDVKSLSGRVWGRTEVVGFDYGDNNKVYINNDKGKPIYWIAEWCELIIKVEDRETKSPPLA